MIRVEGLSLEKFINLTVSKGMYLWKIKRQSYTTLNACISIKDFKKLRPILRAVHCRVKILDKRGFPFIAHRFRHRKMLLAGLVIFIIALYGLSSFIWAVEVEGAKKIDEQMLMEALDEYGVKKGIFKGHIDVRSIENRMMIRFPQLSWVSIQIKGTKAILRVVEAVEPPKPVGKEPCNIIAGKDGIIERMIVLEGQAVVKEGDTVQKGQLLVSGVIEQPNTPAVLVHAMGQIMARTWYEGIALVSLEDFMWERTGRKAVCKYLKMGDWGIEYYREEIPYEKYETVEKNQWMMGENRFLPAKIVVLEYYELKKKPEGVITMEARKKAEELAFQDVRGKVPPGGKIIDKKLKYDMIGREGVEVVVYLEVLEDIGVQKNISAK